jgi:hypothetical protein
VCCALYFVVCAFVLVHRVVGNFSPEEACGIVNLALAKVGVEGFPVTCIPCAYGLAFVARCCIEFLCNLNSCICALRAVLQRYGLARRRTCTCAHV